MRFHPVQGMAVAVSLAMLLWAAGLVRGEQPAAETIAVSKTYNNAPFRYSLRPLAERAAFRIYRLTYPSPVVTPVAQNNTVPADYYLPKQLRPGVKYPAVICLHILDGNEPLTDLVCSVLANRGIPAISFKLPYYGDRGSARGPSILADNPALFVGAIAQAGEDIRRTVDLLSSRPEVNPERIDITGISLGGIIAAAAAGAEPRFYRVGLILAGGDLLAIIHHARETRQLSEMLAKLPPQERADVEGKIAEADPLKFAPALRDRARQGRVLMINASEDEVIPRRYTVKLAEALGIADRITWFEGLGHYTAIAELPRAMRMTADFFAQDLPAGAAPAIPAPSAEPTASRRLASLVEQIVAMLTVEPEQGRCQFADLELSVTGVGSRTMTATVRWVRGAEGRFAFRCQLPEIGDVSLGQNRFPWMLGGQETKTLVAGTKNLVAGRNALAYVDPRHAIKVRMAAGIGGSLALAPEMLNQWIAVEDDKAATGGRAIRIAARDRRKFPGEIRIQFAEDGRTPTAISFNVAGVQGTVRFRGWQTNTVAIDALFDPPEGLQPLAVSQSDLHRMFAATLNFAAERLEDGRNRADVGHGEAISILARDPSGHGLLCRSQGKTILMVSGTPQQMGAAQGSLLGDSIRRMMERVVYLMGAADTLHSGTWFFDRMAEIERRTSPHVPTRLFDECDALAQAAGVSRRDGRYANLFPERFHCSGVAIRGKATAGGRVLHARVLDYMRDIGLQEAATVTVFMPDGRHKWMSLGYAGFVGTVTAMNEWGLAIGEMGGRGDGRWDGMPMSLLLRDVMERASTVEEAVQIICDTPRTCEYYYVVSDRSGAMRGLCCVPEKVTVLEPGQQHPMLPHVPDDAVIISGEDRAKLLGQRIQADYGRIDVPKLIEILKRPVSMRGNLHNAIFTPETLEMWFADAGKHTPACDEPYAHVNLQELIEFYASHVALPRQ